MRPHISRHIDQWIPSMAEKFHNDISKLLDFPSTAGRTLTPLVLVRIQVPQPTKSITYISDKPEFPEHSAYARRTFVGTVPFPLLMAGE